MNALQEFELMEVEEIQSQEQKFEITDLNSLSWAFRKLAALKAKEKEIKVAALAERERIARWEQSELSTIGDSKSFFESLIHNYHQKQLEVDPKVKTISTPYGKSKTRRLKETVAKQDENKLLEYAIENQLDECLKVSLNWSDLKESLRIVEISGEKVVVDDNGQIVEGATVKPETITFSVEV